MPVLERQVPVLRRLVRASKDGLVRRLWTLRGARLGRDVRFYGDIPRVKISGELVVGDNTTFSGGRVRSYLEVQSGGAVRIGSNTFINGGVEIQAVTSVTIGSGCLIGDEVIIQDSSFHEVDEGGSPKVSPVVIGDNVWIARRAVILPGVTIGDHAVVAAGSVVTRNIAARTVVGGSPARFIRSVVASDSFRR